VEITDGDNTPSLADHTDFGDLALGVAFTRSFTIANLNPDNLYLTGSPLVTLTGAAAGDFRVVVSPTTPISANTTTTFQVCFTPSHTGTRAVTLSLANNDSDESPYDFAIQGTGHNLAPVTDAGTDQNVSVNAPVRLVGSASNDPDGHLPLTYGWAQTGGPAVALSNSTVVSPAFTAPAVPGVLTFTLTVTDSFGLPDPTPDTVTVAVSDVPINGLSGTNNGPTLLGHATSFMATLDAGSNVAYIWNFGDNSFGSGAAITHTYVTTGTFTAIVTATNSVSNLSASTLVTITNVRLLFLPLIRR
jgi:hypothetical protein